MDKNEYKKRIKELSTRHVIFPSGLEVDVKVPAAAEMIDALIEAGFDLQELFSHSAEWQKANEEAEKEGRTYFNETVYRMGVILTRTIKDTDGETVADYVKYDIDDFKKLEEVALDFFMESPSLKSIEKPQSTSGSGMNEQDSGPTSSSDSPSPNGTSTSQ